MGEKAEEALLELYNSSDSRVRARALWLLSNVMAESNIILIWLLRIVILILEL